MISQKPEQSNEVVIVANEFWNIFKFRKDLINTLISCQKTIILAGKYDGHESFFLKDSRITCINLHITARSTRLIPNLKVFYGIYLLFKSYPRATFLMYTIKPVIFGAMISRAFNPNNILLNITGLGTAFLNNWLSKFIKYLYRFCIHKNSKIIIQNKEDELFFKKICKNNKRIFLIPGSGINKNKFNPVRYPSTDDGFRFLMISRIIKDKGINEFISAARIVKKSYPNTTFKLVGGFPEGSISDLNFSDIQPFINDGSIDYLGHMDLDKILEEINNCHCFVLPSYREGTSRAIMEACLLERPILTSDVPGCNNLVIHKHNGLLVNSRSTLDLAEKMKEIMFYNIDKLSALGKNGRNHVVLNFSNEVVIPKYIELIG